MKITTEPAAPKDDAIVVWPRYWPMTCLPIVTRIAVMNPPSHVSRHSISASGKYLNSIAINAVASDYMGKVSVGKLNVDDNPNTAFKFQIRGIPAVLLFKGGQVVESVIGLAPKEEFKKAIDKHL